MEPVELEPGRRPSRELKWRGDGKRLDLDRHGPESVAGDGEHAARGTERSGVEHAPARRGEIAHAIALHGEQAHLAGRPEAVLDAAEHPMLAQTLPLEIQDDIDHVLEGARAGDRPLLGDMPDEEHGYAGGLGNFAHAQHRSANLGDASRGSGGRGVPQGLHGIDDRQGRALRLDGCYHSVDIGFDKQANPGTGAPKPPSSQGKLLKRLLTGAVERR